MTDIKVLLSTIQTVLDHVTQVQKDVTKLNHDSMSLLNDEIFEADLELSDDAFIALQHQDILTQQFSATSELLEMINKYIDESNFYSLEKNISDALIVARRKKDAFSGNAFDKRHQAFHEVV
jgi:hypothetical protein